MYTGLISDRQVTKFNWLLSPLKTVPASTHIIISLQLHVAIDPCHMISRKVLSTEGTNNESVEGR